MPVSLSHLKATQRCGGLQVWWGLEEQMQTIGQKWCFLRSNVNEDKLWHNANHQSASSSWCIQKQHKLQAQSPPSAKCPKHHTTLPARNTQLSAQIPAVICNKNVTRGNYKLGNHLTPKHRVRNNPFLTQWKQTQGQRGQYLLYRPYSGMEASDSWKHQGT